MLKKVNKNFTVGNYEPFIKMLIEFNDSELQIMQTAMNTRVRALLVTKEKNKDKEETYPNENDKLDERIDKAVSLYNKLSFERMKGAIKLK